MNEELAPQKSGKTGVRWKFWVSAVCVGVILGLASAAISVGALVAEVESIGPWMHSPHVGAASASHRLRMAVAAIGLFALPQTETAYFNAMTDSEGDLLRGNQSYRLEMEDIDCRWWSVTLYGKHGYLLDNEQNRSSYNMEQIQKNAQGQYVIKIAPEAQEGYWIPTGGSASFDVTLRVYNPSDSFRSQLASGTLELPRLVKGVGVHDAQ